MPIFEAILGYVLSSITSYAVSNQLDKRFSDQNFENRLKRVIQNTVDEFESTQKTHRSTGKFPFYHSQIIIDELLKFRLFCTSGYELNSERIQKELATNSNIIVPENKEIERFMEIFHIKIESDELLSKLEIDDNYKREIYHISDKVNLILSLIESHFAGIDDHTKGEFKREIEVCRKNFLNFKPQTALDWLRSLKDVFIDKPEEQQILSEINYLEALCSELLGKSEEAWKSYVIAYKANSDNFRFKEKAAFAYQYLGDSNAILLADEILQIEDYNTYGWLVKTVHQTDIVNFLKNAPEIVIKSLHFQRLMYVWLRKNSDITTLKKLRNEGVLVKPDFQSIPDIVNYDNYYHWIFILSISLDEYLVFNPIYFHKDSGAIEKAEFLNKLLSQICNVIIDSEIESAKRDIIFYHKWFELEATHEEEKIEELISAYKRLEKKDSLIVLLFANILQQNGRTKEAITYLEDETIEIDSNIVLIRSHCYLQLNELKKLRDSVLEYTNLISEIDSYSLRNFVNFMVILRSPEFKFEEIYDKLINKSFSDEILKKIFSLFHDSFNEEISVESIISGVDEAIIQVNNKYPEMRIVIAQLYFNLNEFDKAVQYLGNWIDKTKESRELHLYIEALAYSKIQQVELLKLLEFWRINFTAIDKFFQKEIHLRQQINDWKTIEEIALNGYKMFLDRKTYLYVLILAFDKNDKHNEIKEFILDIEENEFSKDIRGIRIAGILIRIGEFESGMNLFYQLATEGKLQEARMAYLSLGIHVPAKFFEEKETISWGCYVKMEYNGKIDIIEVAESNATVFPHLEKLIGKKAGEEVRITKPYSGEIEVLKILRIMNKHIALMDEVLTEINNPLKASNIEIISFPEKLEKNEFEEVLIKKLGVKGTLQKEISESNLSKYYNYEISFGELTSFNYDRDYFSSYFSLTTPLSDGFLITPSTYYNNLVEFEKRDYILDIPSLILLFEISKDLDLEFQNKLIISNSTIQSIKDRIQKEKQLPETELSVTVTVDGVIPHHYGKGNKEGRIKFLQSFLIWILENTEVKIPSKKLDLIAQLEPDSSIDDFMTQIIDNHFLVQDENCILVTDDSFYFRFLNPHSGKIISLELFLTKLFPFQANKILLHLATQNYLGLTPSKEALIEAYSKRLSDDGGKAFSVFVRSIAIGDRKPESLLIDTIEFVKYLAINSMLAQNEFDLIVTDIYVNLLKGIFSINNVQFIRQFIEIKFHLLPQHRARVVSCLERAVDILSHP